MNNDSDYHHYAKKQEYLYESGRALSSRVSSEINDNFEVELIPLKECTPDANAYAGDRFKKSWLDQVLKKAQEVRKNMQCARLEEELEGCVYTKNLGKRNELAAKEDFERFSRGQVTRGKPKLQVFNGAPDGYEKEYNQLIQKHPDFEGQIVVPVFKHKEIEVKSKAKNSMFRA